MQNAAALRSLYTFLGEVGQEKHIKTWSVFYSYCSASFIANNGRSNSFFPIHKNEMTTSSGLNSNLVTTVVYLHLNYVTRLVSQCKHLDIKTHTKKQVNNFEVTLA